MPNFLKKFQTNIANGAASVEATPAARPTVIPKSVPPRPTVPGAIPSAPGARPTVPGTRPPAPGVRPSAPTIPTAKPTIPGIKPSAPKDATEGPIAKKGNPFKIEKNKEAVVPEIVEAPKVEVSITPKVEAVVPEVKIEETIAPVVEESITLAKEVNTPIVETKKTTVKGSRKKNTTAKKETVVLDNSLEEESDIAEIIIPKTEGSYADAVLAIKSTFVDEEWDVFKSDTSERLGEIQIVNDMGPAALKQTISDLNSLRDSVWLQFLDTKTFFETLTAKDDGLLDRVKRLHSKGSNDNERKINSAVALMNYKEDGKSINLYEILDASRARFNYTKGLMDSIQYKSNAVITMLGNLKLEK